jgi:ABC-2 type transport system permease protein
MIYLYNLLTLAWTYMTPIFYDISIVGDQMVPVFRANPMYQYVTFARNIILYHKIPSTQQFVILFVFGAAALIDFVFSAGSRKNLFTIYKERA